MRKPKPDTKKQYYEVTNIIQLAELLRIKYELDIVTMPANLRKLCIHACFNHKQRVSEFKKMYEILKGNAKTKEELVLALSRFWGYEHRYMWRMIKNL